MKHALQCKETQDQAGQDRAKAQSFTLRHYSVTPLPVISDESDAFCASIYSGFQDVVTSYLDYRAWALAEDTSGTLFV